jgi:hypothetical protein
MSEGALLVGSEWVFDDFVSAARRGSLRGELLGLYLQDSGADTVTTCKVCGCVPSACGSYLLSLVPCQQPSPCPPPPRSQWASACVAAVSCRDRTHKTVELCPTHPAAAAAAAVAVVAARQSSRPVSDVSLGPLSSSPLL